MIEKHGRKFASKSELRRFEAAKKPQEKPRHFEADIAVSLRDGVCLRRIDTKEWVFMRRLRNGRLVRAEMPERIKKQIAGVQ